jgi:hypothetical protein
MKKYFLLLAVSFLGQVIAAEPLSTDLSNTKSRQVKENIKNTDEPIVLEKVIVTDKKLHADSLTKTEIKAGEIAGRQAQVQDTAKLLEDIQGVSLQASGGVSSLPIIHGFNDDRVKLMSMA